MKSLHHFISQIKDHRRAQGVRVPYGDYLEMIILAHMSGRFGLRAIARFISNNRTFFIERYGLLHGTPSGSGISKFIKGIDYDELTKAVSKWANQYLEPSDWIAIDGKAIGSTMTNSTDSQQNFKSMVSSFCQKKGIVLDAIGMENKKEHEGQLARDLIARFDQQGMIFTLDALHCQKKQPRLSWSQEMTMSFK